MHITEEVISSTQLYTILQSEFSLSDKYTRLIFSMY